MANGKGKFTHVNGDVYEGDILSNHANGIGKLITNEFTYKG